MQRRLGGTSNSRTARLCRGRLRIRSGIHTLVISHLHVRCGLLIDTLGRIIQLSVIRTGIHITGRLHLTRPMVARNGAICRKLFGPTIRTTLHARNERCRPISVTFKGTPALVSNVGVNNGAMYLGALTLTRALYRFTVCIPTTRDRVILISYILFSVSSKRGRLDNLSSFTTRVRTMGGVVTAVGSNVHPLILVSRLTQAAGPARNHTVIKTVLGVLRGRRIHTFMDSRCSGVTASYHHLHIEKLHYRLSSTVSFGRVSHCVSCSLIRRNDTSIPRRTLGVTHLLKVSPRLVSLTRDLLWRVVGLRVRVWVRWV